jgi:hypothetical protein
MLASVFLKLLKHEVKMGKARQSDADKSAGKERLTVRSPEEVRAVTIDLLEYALDIERRKLWGAKLPELKILKPVSTTFQPSKLNVIM